MQNKSYQTEQDSYKSCLSEKKKKSLPRIQDHQLIFMGGFMVQIHTTKKSQVENLPWLQTEIKIL